VGKEPDLPQNFDHLAVLLDCMLVGTVAEPRTNFYSPVSPSREASSVLVGSTTPTSDVIASEVDPASLVGCSGFEAASLIPPSLDPEYGNPPVPYTVPPVPGTPPDDLPPALPPDPG
jgi:hypothetical protein